MTREYEPETREEEIAKLNDDHVAELRNAIRQREALWRELDTLYRKHIRHADKGRTGCGTSRITRSRMLLGLTREENPLKPVVDGTRNFGDWHDDGGIS